MSPKSEKEFNGFLASVSKLFGQLHEMCEKHKGNFKAGSGTFSLLNANDSDIKKPKKKIVDPLKSDPNAPKKPIIQAYLMYYRDVRTKRHEENPLLANMDLTKVIAEEWNKLTKEQRKPYEDQAQANRDQYERELQAYLDKNPDMKAKLSAKRRRRKASTSGVGSQNAIESSSEAGGSRIHIIDTSSEGTGLDHESSIMTPSHQPMDSLNVKRPTSPEGSFDYSSSDDDDTVKKIKI